MHGDLTEFLAFPRGRSFPLELSGAPSNGKQILEGELRCPAYGDVFSIVAGIPRFVEEQSLGELQRHEMEVRDQAHRSRTFRIAVSDLPEYDAARSALGDCRGLRALDAGCGSGKMSSTLGSPVRLVGVDFSFAALLKFHFPGDSRVYLVQSEGSQMPIREACFDVALRTQVLEHLLSQELRVGSLRQIGRALKPGGKLVLTVYNWNLYSQRSRGSQEVFHENGIFYDIYLVEELRSELGEMCKVETIQQVRTILPKTYRVVQALGRKNIYWERVWRKTMLALQYGDTLLAVGHRRA